MIIYYEYKNAAFINVAVSHESEQKSNGNSKAFFCRVHELGGVLFPKSSTCFRVYNPKMNIQHAPTRVEHSTGKLTILYNLTQQNSPALILAGFAM